VAAVALGDPSMLGGSAGAAPEAAAVPDAAVAAVDALKPR